MTDGVLLSYYIYHWILNVEYLEKGENMIVKYADIFGNRMAYRIYGAGKVDIVLMTGLGGCIGEYEKLAQRLAKKHTVLCYERFGCGSSEETRRERTPVNIARECAELLKYTAHEKKIILVAHSQGGLYADQYARLYPDQVEKVILLDPLSPEDDLFGKRLTAEEYRKSGVDKTKGLRINLLLLRLGMGGLVRRMMKNAPPFYYYNNFEPDETDYILKNMTRKATYRTALKEYEMAHAKEYLQGLRTDTGFPNVPLYLITHSSDIAIEEIMTFGNADRETAVKVEELWQEVMKAYLTLSGQSRHFCAKNSSHAIHLTDIDLVAELL